MPIMVIPRRIPKSRCMKHAHNPPKMIQMILRRRLRHPDGQSVSLISAPNGHRHKMPILNVCRANGSPIIVMASARLPVKYPMAASSPPKIHHSKFPIIRIQLIFKNP